MEGPTKQKKCKSGKVPLGKGGRCVNPKTKKCKAGKVPEGKRGRCVNPKTLNRGPAPVHSAISTLEKEKNVRKQIDEFMEELDDFDFFTRSEIDHIVKIAVAQDLTRDEIDQGLEELPKSTGVFM